MKYKSKRAALAAPALLTALSFGFAPNAWADGHIAKADGDAEASHSVEAELDAMKKRLADLEEKVAADAADTGGAAANDVSVSWDAGLVVSDAAGTFKIRVGGRVHAEATFQNAENKVETAAGDLQDGFEVRRGRLQVLGYAFSHAEFKAQFEFTGSGDGQVDVKDAYVGLRDLPFIGTVRFGHQKEPFGLEELESTNDLPFIERALTSTLFTQRNTGLRVMDHFQEKITWSFGAYRAVNNQGVGVSEGDYNFTARVSALVFGRADDDTRVHLAFGYSYRNPASGNVTFATGPLSNLAPNLVNTGAVRSVNLDQLGGELAITCGAWTVRGEAVYIGNDGPGDTRNDFYAYYGEVSYFVTGEQREYNGKRGTYLGVTPNNELFGEGGGYGAIELAARFSEIDLDSGQVQGGKLNTITGGVNWYFYKHVRLMANYTFANLQGVGNADVVQFRLQFAF